jgi:hypothetical protein
VHGSLEFWIPAMLNLIENLLDSEFPEVIPLEECYIVLNSLLALNNFRQKGQISLWLKMKNN